MLGIRIFVSKVIVVRIEDLKIFVDVVRYHSMNIAAEKNFTTPQNLSKIIKRMEDELGVVLFKRSRKGSDLTDEGERFYLQVLNVIRCYEEAVLAITVDHSSFVDKNNNIQKKRVNVLCSSGAISYAVMKTYNQIRIENLPLILEEEEIAVSNPKKIIKSVEENEFDIIACYIEQENLETVVKTLGEYILLHVIFDKLVLIVSKDNPICHRHKVSVSELNKLQLVLLKGFPPPEGLTNEELNADFFTSSHSKALRQIEQFPSYGILLLNSFCAMNPDLFYDHGNLRKIELDIEVTGTYIILVRSDCLDSREVMHFVSALEENLRGRNKEIENL